MPLNPSIFNGEFKFGIATDWCLRSIELTPIAVVLPGEKTKKCFLAIIVDKILNWNPQNVSNDK